MQLKEVQSIRNLLNSFPENKWCRGVRYNKRGQHCALGFVETYGEGGDIAAMRINDSIHRELGFYLAVANNGIEFYMKRNWCCSEASQVPKTILDLPTPKQRSLAALDMLIEKMKGELQLQEELDDVMFEALEIVGEEPILIERSE